MVNGFKLTGNVLGPGVATQGGNYYWNYGTGPNGYWRMPYVSRFYYSDWSYIFPLGCGSIQAPGAPCGTPPPLVGAYENGIQVRGDYAPYGPSVVFTESGLAKGSTWSVTIHGLQIGSTSTTITVELPYGNDSWHGSAPGWTGTPASGYLVVNGVVVIHIAFTLNPAVPSVPAPRGEQRGGGPPGHAQRREPLGIVGSRVGAGRILIGPPSPSFPPGRLPHPFRFGSLRQARARSPGVMTNK